MISASGKNAASLWIRERLSGLKCASAYVCGQELCPESSISEFAALGLATPTLPHDLRQLAYAHRALESSGGVPTDRHNCATTTRARRSAALYAIAAPHIYSEPLATASVARAGASLAKEQTAAANGAKNGPAAAKEVAHGPQYKTNVMFLCNHAAAGARWPAARLRQLRGDAEVGVASAGIVGGTAVKPGAVEVMREAGVDISSFTSDDIRGL